MTDLLSPISRTAHGLRTYMAGVSWLKSHPQHLILLFVPMVLGLVFLIAGWGFFYTHGDTIFSYFWLEKPEAMWLLPVYYAAKIVVYVGGFLLGLLVCVLATNVVASPIYEIISVAVERDLKGGVEEVSLWESIGLMGEELKKVALILSVSTLLLVIPGVNVIATFITAFLVGWDFYDYPLARRGWSFRERFRFVLKDFWSVMGFGLWLMIPFVQVLLMPMSVVGGTILCLEAIDKKAA